MLCEAVVELHNPQRIAGLDRYLAHRHLVPAVVEELGPWAIPSDTSTPMAADGEDMLELIADPTYASMHPNYAATAALYIIEDALGFDGLQALIAVSKHLLLLSKPDCGFQTQVAAFKH